MGKQRRENFKHNGYEEQERRARANQEEKGSEDDDEDDDEAEEEDGDGDGEKRQEEGNMVTCHPKCIILVLAVRENYKFAPIQIRPPPIVHMSENWCRQLPTRSRRSACSKFYGAMGRSVIILQKFRTARQVETNYSGVPVEMPLPPGWWCLTNSVGSQQQKP